jgi:hypothetical protein
VKITQQAYLCPMVCPWWTCSLIKPANPASLCLMNGLPSGSIVLVSPLGGFPGSIDAEEYGYSGGTLFVSTSGSQGEYSFAAFPGS